MPSPSCNLLNWHLFALFLLLISTSRGEKLITREDEDQSLPFVQSNPFASPNSPSAFIQAENGASHSSRTDGQVRPYRRYIFDIPRFARPPDPHTVWREGLGGGKRHFAPIDSLQAEVPQSIRNYFSLDASADKVVKELAGVDLKKILGPVLDQLVESTTAPAWTRATTPKDKLVEYFEKSLDDFLAGRFRPMERIPYLLEKEKLLEAKNGTFGEIATEAERQKDEDLLEGSGEGPGTSNGPHEQQQLQGELDEQQQQPRLLHSSIAGIPKQMPTFPKIPLDFFAEQQKDGEIASRSVELKKPPMEEGGEAVEVRRHPVKRLKAAENRKFEEKGEEEGGGGGAEQLVAKTMQDYFQYGTKPSYQQGVLGSMLDFFGINSPSGGAVELDKVLTEWLMEHTPKHRPRMDGRWQSKARGESSYNLMKHLLSQPVVPLCPPQLEALSNFDIDAFMGQWFEVMQSAPVESSSSSILSFQMLSKTEQLNSVGSLFQTLQFSMPQRIVEDYQFSPNAMQQKRSSPKRRQQLSSGYAVLSRPGQIVFHKSNSPEEVIVHLIDAGYSLKERRYEWAILGINCNYPIYVLARDPFLFKQKYERLVLSSLEQKGIISELGRLLNLVTAVEPIQWEEMPKNLFN